MTSVLTHEQLLEYWQGHRRLTRRTIEVFPDDTAFATFSVGEMRPFAKIVNEFFSMSVPTLVGVVSGEWTMGKNAPPTSRAEALERWDADTDRINSLWPGIPGGRLQETEVTFSGYKTRVNDLLFYVIDNEVHHRGQVYVYLRALGVVPPQFPDRS